MVFELVNPSDEILFDAPDAKVAFVCALLVGSGAYPAKAKETGEDAGGFLLFAANADAEIESRLGMTGDQFVRENAVAVNACFKTFRYVRERTSMNRIVDYAHTLSVGKEGVGG
jgi:hypothetical protein